MNMNENEKRERTTPPAQSATSPYTGEAREKIIHGLKCKTHQIVDDCYNCPYTEPDKKNRALVCGQRILLDALELLQALDVTPEELERLKKCRHECKIDCLLEHYEKIKAERDALLKAKEPQWTPITIRALTEEEKAEHPDWCYIIDSTMPDDGDEILVSDGKNVWADVWCNDGEWCGLERGNELEGVAWMKMPTPWKREATPWQGH